MKKLPALALLLCLGCAAASNSTSTLQKSPQKVSVKTSGIAGKTDGMQKYEGFFEFYYDEKTDKIFITVDKFDQEFLYVNSLAAGVGSNDIGLDRNQLGNERVVKFERRGPKVLLVQPNYRYRAISDNADEKKSVEDAFAKSVLWGFTLVTEEDGKVLIDATDFLMQDAHDVIGRLKGANQGSYSIDKTRSAFYLDRTKNFPKNAEFEVTLSFKGNAQGPYIRSVTPTPDNVTVRQHHSFVELPDNNYKPRVFDPRAGYYSMSYLDYATPISENIEKRFITRHRLEKKDPTAAIGEAVEPIIYYLDRGTPEPVLSALMDGARWWNQAFEAAGYKDAFQVKLLPEGVDPMDVRYNMINWVHRSTRGWSYGTSVTDPRTGEIIKGHVLLGSLRVRQDFLIAEGLLAPYENGTTVSDEMQQMALARLRQLSAHEVGHTLGLAHSYSSSTEGRASVMDYPHPVVKINNGQLDLSDAYDDKIGTWDKVSINYGYRDFADGVDEEEELDKIIVKSLGDGLTFLSDQDARPRGGAHAYAHLWDNGKNPSDELNHMLEVRKIAINQFGENNIKPREPYAKLEEVLVPIYFFHRYQTEAAVKLIGGLNYRYALKGDGQPITQLVSKSEQQKTLDALLKTISPDHLALPESVLKMIPPRPIGYDRTREIINIRTGLTFDPLGAAESATYMTTSLLFHPARAQRLVEYSARNNDQLSLAEVLDQVINATWKSANQSGMKGEIQRTVNDVVLMNLMHLASNTSSGNQVRAISYLKIQDLKQWLADKQNVSNLNERAHFMKAFRDIEEFENNPSKYRLEIPLDPPAGSPIGADMRCDF